MSALDRVQARVDNSRLNYAQGIRARPTGQGGGTAAGYNAANGTPLIRLPNGQNFPVRATTNGAVRTGTPQAFSVPRATLPRTDAMPR